MRTTSQNLNGLRAKMGLLLLKWKIISQTNFLYVAGYFENGIDMAIEFPTLMLI